MTQVLEAPATRTRAEWPWVYWGLGAVCYLVALFHRTSLSVAAGEATERFNAGAGALGLFTGLQLGVYLALQIPAGLVADRCGPRRVLTMAGLALAGGALLLSVSGSLWAGLVARALTGFGDAFMFVSTLQLAARWFPRRYALVAGLTGLMGALGQVVSALPLTAMLHAWGWTATFAGAAVVTVLIALVTAVGARDGQAVVRDGVSEPVMVAVRRAWALAGTRRAFWCHFVLMGQFVAFSALWGGPWLREAQGLSAGEAGSLLMSCPIGMAIVSFGGGRVIAGDSRRREMVIGSWLVLSLPAWVLLVVMPEPMPMALLVPVLLLIGGGGGGGPLVFDIARTANPAHRSGTAAGVVNVGGFALAVFAQVVVGIVVGATGSFRVAFLPVLAVLAAGVLIAFRTGRGR